MTPPDTPSEKPVPYVAMNLFVEDISESVCGMVSLVGAVYADGLVMWHRFELPTHKRVVREASKRVREYHQMLRAIRTEADVQRVRHSQIPYSLEGVLVGQDQNPHLDLEMANWENMPTLVIANARLERMS